MKSRLYFSLDTLQSEDDFDDIPTSGFADREGIPYFIRLNEQRSIIPERFVYDLAPVGDDVFSCVQEIAKIWRDWELNYYAGVVPLSTHPNGEVGDSRYKSLLSYLEQQVGKLSRQYSLGAEFSTSPERERVSKPLIGKRWPVPGWYSRELEITWRPEYEV